MGTNTVNIILSDGREIYHPGDTVNGTVKLTVGDPIRVKEIRLKTRGKARVLWVEGDGQNLRVFYKKKKYISETKQLMQMHEGQKEDVTYQQGTYNFPFSVKLPDGIPSSYHGSCGRVLYESEATVVRPWTSNLSVKFPFTVVPVLNLNELPNVSKQMVATDEKTLCCLCCVSGQMSATISTERQGYVPGEAIKFWAEIRNDSRRNIKYYEAKLIMKAAYDGGAKIRLVDYVLQKVRGKSVPAGRTDTWSGEKLLIPPVPPTFPEGSCIIRIQYFVTITIVPSGPACNLDVPAEVIIGTIPILREGQPPAQPEFKENEIIKGDGFAPLYPYYNLERQQPMSNFQSIYS